MMGVIRASSVMSKASPFLSPPGSDDSEPADTGHLYLQPWWPWALASCYFLFSFSGGVVLWRGERNYGICCKTYEITACDHIQKQQRWQKQCLISEIKCWWKCLKLSRLMGLWQVCRIPSRLTRLSACMILYNEVKPLHAHVQDFKVKPLPSFSISSHCIELIKFSICYGLSFSPRRMNVPV